MKTTRRQWPKAWCEKCGKVKYGDPQIAIFAVDPDEIVDVGDYCTFVCEICSDSCEHTHPNPGA